jgi:short-subunit dehydrogenase
MQRIVIFGATSGIAEAVARDFAKESAAFVLVGRNGVALEDIKNDLIVRGATSVNVLVADLADVVSLARLCHKAQETLGGIDVAVIAHGTLPDQAVSIASSVAMFEVMQVNSLSPAALMVELGVIMSEQGHGSLVILSSVAGDRGRPSNFVYGASKSLLSTLGEGMALGLKDKGVNVLVVKPGFVDTKMTAAFKKGPLWASASDVGGAIVKAVKAGKSGVLYTPRFWELIMLIVKFAPGFIVKRM